MAAYRLCQLTVSRNSTPSNERKKEPQMTSRSFATQKSTLAMFAVATSLSCAAQHKAALTPPPLTDKLPVSRVILYQNGVGYFEREGNVDDGAITIHCRRHQINDLLKSLTVIDYSSGRPVSVSLPLEKTGSRILHKLPKQVRNVSGLLDVLRVFRGARVRVSGDKGSVSGRVVGVDRQIVEGKKGPLQGYRLTLKSPSGSLEVYPVHAIRKVAMVDRALEIGLDRSLDVSLDQGAWRPVKLTVRLAGKDTHKLRVSYIVEMPNWKPAYRLVIPDGKRQPLLQGWAVVDNVSGESWRDVKLSLVAGTPMSFIYDLHTPRFTRRVDLTPRGTRTALAPTTEKPGFGSDGDDASKVAGGASAKDQLQRLFSRRSRRARRRYFRKPRIAKKESYKASKRQFSEDARGLNVTLQKQMVTRVRGNQIAGLFRYDLTDRVTVPDNSSTLVNIINSRVPGGEVVLFRPELTRHYNASHPYRAVRFTNNSGFALEKGPVTIYSGNTFVGEGFLERMNKGATTFLTFAIDNNVTLRRTSRSGYEVVKLLKIDNGRILSEMRRTVGYEYALTNRHTKPITAYIKTQRPGGSYKLHKAPQKTIRAGNIAYVPKALPAKGKSKLKVTWSTPVQRWVSITSAWAPTALNLFASSGKVPAAIRGIIDKLVKGQKRLAEISPRVIARALLAKRAF
jgi:hypothetical protein